MNEDEFLFGKRHAPMIFATIDRIVGEVNTKLRMRGIGKGMVCVQENINRTALEMQKRIYDAVKEPDASMRMELINYTQRQMKYMWTDIRFLLKQRALTLGEIGVLSDYANATDKQLEKWKKSIDNKLSQVKAKCSEA